jgi:hypothetical protein
MSIVRGIVAMGLLSFVIWAAWFIAYTAGGGTVIAPPGVQ